MIIIMMLCHKSSDVHIYLIIEVEFTRRDCLVVLRRITFLSEFIQCLLNKEGMEQVSIV